MNSRAKLVLLFTLFLIFVSTHMQFPIFTPLASSLGATSFMIGAVLSIASFLNLGGNILAGTMMDRIGVRLFIIIPLLLLALSFMVHTFVVEAGQLFALRMLNSLIYAFLTPACMALLSSFAKNSVEQSKNMALNILIITLAAIIAPVLGGVIGEQIGAIGTYTMISLIIAMAFLMSLYFLRLPVPAKKEREDSKGILSLLLYPPLFPAYLTGFGLMFAQGTLFYEIPFLSVEHGVSKSNVGMMAAFMGMGTLFILCFTFLHRLSAKGRCLGGLFLLAFSSFTLASQQALPSFFPLFIFGGALGIIYPAMMTLVSQSTSTSQRGKAFALLSAVFSLGTISAPLLAGTIRNFISPYFIACLVLLAAITVIGRLFLQVREREKVYLS